MTRSDAIKILDSIWAKGMWRKTNEIDWNKAGDAIDMAIEALQQVTGKLNNPDDSLFTADSEACKEQKSKLDLISRTDAIEAIEIIDWYHQNSNKDMVSGANDDEHQAWYKADDVYKALEAVPSADRPTDGDLISRAEAIKRLLLFKRSRAKNVSRYDMGFVDGLSHAINILDLVPLVYIPSINILDLVPSANRPRGEWHKNVEYSATGNERAMADQCSVCSGMVPWGMSDKFDFCPNCGADMRPTERSEE